VIRVGMSDFQTRYARLLVRQRNRKSGISKERAILLF